MDLNHIRHDNLRRLMQDLNELGMDMPDEDLNNLFREIRHSSLLTAGNIIDGEFKLIYAETDGGDFGVLFSDMDELRKTFPDFETQAYSFVFDRYLEILKDSDLKGFFINIDSEGFVFPSEFGQKMGKMPEMEFSAKNSYSMDEIRKIKNTIDNADLEDFIKNPANTARYEELFDKISKSTILTLRLSDIDVDSLADDGMISMKNTGPIGFLHSENTGGRYATAFTSDDKIKGITTDYHKYAQLINFSQMINYVLNDDMDGVIINPADERIMLTREVLLEFSPLLEKTCNDSGLNSAIFYMFLVEEK